RPAKMPGAFYPRTAASSIGFAVLFDGELWFVLADVCEVLELSRVTETAKATRKVPYRRLEKNLILSGLLVTTACTRHRRCGNKAPDDKAQTGAICAQRGIHILL